MKTMVSPWLSANPSCLLSADLISVGSDGPHILMWVSGSTIHKPHGPSQPFIISSSYLYHALFCLLPSATNKQTKTHLINGEVESSSAPRIFSPRRPRRGGGGSWVSSYQGEGGMLCVFSFSSSSGCFFLTCFFWFWVSFSAPLWAWERQTLP